jgi:hypothetical protein
VSFDWLEFLRGNNIDYEQHARDVGVHCPFCGAADRGRHMWISLHGRGWHCWRHSEHKGHKPLRLVAALLNCDLRTAHRIVGYERVYTDAFMHRVRSALEPQPAETRQPLQLPAEFKPFREVPTARPYIEYLKGRGYLLADILQFTERYGMRYCPRGQFSYRIIFPVYFDAALVNWTGRSVVRNAMLRYRTLSSEPSAGPVALAPITDYLLWFDDLRRETNETLLLCEGPFDALRVRHLGRALGVTATCCFTAAPSRQQVDLLHELAPRFRRCIVLLDSGSAAESLRTQAVLRSLDFEVKMLTEYKDPALLDILALQTLLHAK